jgi:hypothetical protein
MNPQPRPYTGGVVPGDGESLYQIDELEALQLLSQLDDGTLSIPDRVTLHTFLLSRKSEASDWHGRDIESLITQLTTT